MVNRKTPEYKLWRAKVYALGGWKCCVCSSKKDLEAHHIYTVRKYPEKALEEQNGVPLCRRCHNLINGKEDQLVKFFTDLRANGVNSVKTHDVKKDIMDNTEPTREGDLAKGVTTRNRVFKIEQFIDKQVPCVICSKLLMRHYHRVQRSKIFFCSRKCRGKWIGKKAIEWNRKTLKKGSCLFCKKELIPTPSSKHRNKKFCGNSCHSKYMWRVQKRKPTSYLEGRWTAKFDSCVVCGTKEKRHYGNGRCMTCYNKNYNARFIRQ